MQVPYTPTAATAATSNTDMAVLIIPTGGLDGAVHQAQRLVSACERGGAGAGKCCIEQELTTEGGRERRGREEEAYGEAESGDAKGGDDDESRGCEW